MPQDIQAELLRLVEFYTQKSDSWTTELLDTSVLLRIDNDFIAILNKFLLEDGPQQEHIDKNYKKLVLHFHPDKLAQCTNQVRWLEKQLSGGRNQGICFQTLQLCYEKLTDPNKFKEIEFSNIYTVDELRSWLEKKKVGAKTYSSRNLYDSLLNLLNQSNSFLDEAGRIKPYALKTLVSFVPVVFASYGAIMIFEEFLALYLLYFLLLKGGKRLSGSDSMKVHQFGEGIRSYTSVTAALTTTFLVHILEMLFWSSQKCLHETIEVSSRFFAPMLVDTGDCDETDGLVASRALVEAHRSTGLQFDTPEFKTIAAPFERYLELNAQQSFSGLRVGGSKKKAIEAFLFQLQLLDKNTERSFEDRLQEIDKALISIKSDKALYTGKTATTIDYVQKVLDLFQGKSPADTSEVFGIQFKAPELKAIAAPFEHYLVGTTQQSFFRLLPVASLKRQLVEGFLFHLQVLDQMSLGLEDKLHRAQEELSRIRENKNVYQGRTAKATDCAQNALKLLTDSSEKLSILDATS